MATGIAAPGWRIRRIHPSDRGRLATFYAGLTAESREARFHGGTAGVSERVAAAFCHPDHDHREGFVAVMPGTGDDVVIGHLCLEPIDDADLEVAVAVADLHQGRGVGRALLRAAVAWARKHGYARLTAIVRPTNGAMLGLLRSAGLPITMSAADVDEVEAVLALTPGRARAA